MGQKTSRPEISDERKALALLQQALAILDAIDAPGDIGAHVDFAIERLRDEIAKRTTLAARIVGPSSSKAQTSE